MKVILFATGDCAEIDSLNSRTPAPLLPLVDRPFIQHVVETLAAQGATSFDVVLGAQAEKFVDLLGDGTRWGVHFKYHLARDARQPYGILKSLHLDNPKESVLIVHGDRIPMMEAGQLERLQELGTTSAFFLTPATTPDEKAFLEWTGWAYVPVSYFSAISMEMDQQEVGDHLLRAAGQDEMLVYMPQVIGVTSFDQLLQSQKAVLTGTFKGLLLTGRKIKGTVRKANNAVVHPAAQITGPVFLGENCRIGAFAQIGPNVVIGENCVIDSGTVVNDSLVMAGTYVGERLELSRCIADHNYLVNTKIGTAVSVSDDFLLGSVCSTDSGKLHRRLMAQPAAAALVLVSAPSLALTSLWIKMFKSGAGLH